MKGNIRLNRIYNTIYSLLNVAFPLATSMYVSRILLTDGVGKVSFAQTIPQYFVILAFLGIPTYGTKVLSQLRGNRDEIDKAFSEVFILNIISTLISTVLYYLVVIFTPGFEDKTLFFITGVVILLNAINVDWVYTAFEDFKYITIRSFIVKFFSLLCVFLLIKSPDDYIIYTLILIVASCGSNIYNVIHLRKFVRLNFKKLDIKSIITPVLVLFSVNIAVELYSLVTTTAMGILCEDSDIGIYTYAIRIVNIVRQLITSLVLVSVPEMCNASKNNNKERFDYVINDTLKTILYIGTASIVGYILLADNIVVVLFGNAFSEAIAPSRILSLTALIAPIGYLLGNRVLLATDNDKKILYGVWIGAITNIALSFSLIHWFGYYGASIAYLISELIVAIVHIYIAKGNYTLQISKKYFRSLLISLIAMSIIIIFVRIIFKNIFVELILGVTTGVIVFFTASYLTKNEVILDFIKKRKK